MKNVNFRNLMKLTWALLLGLVFIASSCKDDTEDPPPVVVLDGLYVKGGATALTDFDSKGMMKVTRNEVTQTDRTSLKEIYIAVKAGSPGFNIVDVAGSVQKTYGPGTGFGKVTKGTTDEPKVEFQRGAYAETTTAFTVPKDGIYHIIIDTDLKKVVIVPVDYWGLIGASTPGGWSNDTKINPGAFNLNTMTFEVTNVTMLKGQFKFRYSGGWKVEVDTVLDLGGGKKGVKANTNFGGTVAAPVPGGDNINFDVPGIYTAKAVWTLGTGWAFTLTKTGDVPTIDYTNYEMGIIGDCYYKPDGVTPAAWDVPFGLSKPVVSGKIFTWTYSNINLIAGKEFKFRQGMDWSGKSIGYPDATWTGAAASNFSNNGGNVKVAAGGSHTIVLKIDATTEVYTVTCTKN